MQADLRTGTDVGNLGVKGGSFSVHVQSCLTGHASKQALM